MTSAPAVPRFPMGVASFDPGTDGVLLWTGLDGHERCSWEVATDRSFTAVVAAGEAEALGATGTVTVEVDGLAPGTTHWYRFRARDGALSPVGRTRTMPAGPAARFRIAAVCCARYGQSEFEVYRAVADTDVDLVVHLGDYVYEDAKADCEGREPDPDHACVTLDDYRARHAQARRDPDAQALHAAHPMVVIWDDHDLADNAWRGGAKGHDPDTQGPWSERMAAALQAHHEFLPKRLADPTDLSSAWRRIDGGDLFTVVCTEGRAHRDEQAGNEGSAAADDPDRTLLGAVQARWLADAVAGTDAAWLVLLSGTIVSELVIPAPQLLDGVLPEKYAVVDGEAANTDQWDGYRAERHRLAEALADRGSGSLVLSGDIHSSWAVEGPLGADGVPVAVELVCPPAATTPLGQLFPPGIGTRMASHVQEQMPSVRWVDVDHRGYLTVDLHPDRADATWWWVGDGATDAGSARRSEGSAQPGAVQGRRWVVPRVAPAGLLDPEPRQVVDRSRPKSDRAGARPRRGRRVVALTAAAVGVVAGARWARSRVDG